MQSLNCQQTSLPQQNGNAIWETPEEAPNSSNFYSSKVCHPASPRAETIMEKSGIPQDAAKDSSLLLLIP